MAWVMVWWFLLVFCSTQRGNTFIEKCYFGRENVLSDLNWIKLIVSNKQNQNQNYFRWQHFAQPFQNQTLFDFQFDLHSKVKAVAVCGIEDNENLLKNNQTIILDTESKKSLNGVVLIWKKHCHLDNTSITWNNEYDEYGRRLCRPWQRLVDNFG